jgi:RHS repeat-associated protein
LLASIYYPYKDGASVGQPNPNDKESFAYNALDQARSADRNGTGHNYSFDVLGRITSDQAQTLGGGVDGTVRRLDTAYDTGGRPYLFTSYGDLAGTVTLNQVKRSFNGLGQLTAETQYHGDPSNPNSPRGTVSYAYSPVSSTSNYSRPISMTYPNNRVLDYVYNTTTTVPPDYAGLDGRISRLSYLADDNNGTPSTHLEEYSYLGLDTVVQRAHPQPGVNLTYIQQAGDTGTGDDHDQYTGSDRFGRIVDQRWIPTATPQSPTDRFQYGYDRDSNALYKNNLVNGTFSELYHANGLSNGYDRLNQLTNFARGTLSASTQNGPLDTVASPSRTQGWTLDAMGNWSSIATAVNGGTPTTQTRAHNAQNQITRVNDATGPAYDNNGNMLVDENGQQYSFDAWNRLVTVKSSAGATQETYAYDAVGRRIQENVVVGGGPNRDLYYNQAWQVIEERESNNTLVRSQQVWDPLAPDTLVLRDRDMNGTGTMSERLYVQQDANGNVTAVINSAGAVQERYIEDPYGQPSYLTAGWQPQGGPLCQAGVSCVKWVYLHQGGRYDPTTGLFNFRNRDYSPTLGRWMRVDPLGFDAGDTNLYRTVGNNPTNWIDPSGLAGVDPSGQIWWAPNWAPGEKARMSRNGTVFNQFLIDAGDTLIGIGDGASLGVSVKIRQAAGYDDVVNKGSKFYKGGEIAGTTITIVVGGANPCALSKAGGLALKGLNAVQAVGNAANAVDSWNNGDYVGAGLSALGTLGNIGQLNKACFAAGTPLLTPTGDKPIEQFQPGDWILSAAEDDPNGALEAKQVEELITNHAGLLNLHVGGQVIRTTSEHPFYVRGQGWRSAGELQAGDQLRSHDGRWATVETITDGGEFAAVYNLRIAEYHTYFVGSREWGFCVWAHNNCNSKLLGKALEDAQEVRGAGQHAAHLVPTGAFTGRTTAVQKAVKTAQKALAKAGIGINSAENGFFAPVGHNGTHTNEYLLKLGKLMSDAMKNKNVKEVLKQIKDAKGMI